MARGTFVACGVCPKTINFRENHLSCYIKKNNIVNNKDLTPLFLLENWKDARMVKI